MLTHLHSRWFICFPKLRFSDQRKTPQWQTGLCPNKKNTSLVSQRGIEDDSILFSVNWYPFISWWPFESRLMYQKSNAHLSKSDKGFKVPLNFPVQASVPPLSGVFQQWLHTGQSASPLVPCTPQQYRRIMRVTVSISFSLFKFWSPFCFIHN